MKRRKATKRRILDKARRQKARVKFVKSEDGGLRSNNVAGVNEEERGDEEENPEDIPLPETSQSFQDSSKEENSSTVSEGIAKLKSSMADEENWCSFESDTSSLRGEIIAMLDKLENEMNSESDPELESVIIGMIDDCMMKNSFDMTQSLQERVGEEWSARFLTQLGGPGTLGRVWEKVKELNLLLSSKRKYSATSSEDSASTCDEMVGLVRDLNLNSQEYDASNEAGMSGTEGMSFSSRESVSIPGLVTSQESVTTEEECEEGSISELCGGEVFTDDLVLVYKGNGVFKQVPRQGRNDYKVVMWSEIDTGNGKREERCEISGLYDSLGDNLTSSRLEDAFDKGPTAGGPGLCDKLDENLTGQGMGDEGGMGLTVVRPSLCGKLDENLTGQDMGDGCGTSLTVVRPSLNDKLSGNLTAPMLGKGREGEEIVVGKAESVKNLEDGKVDGWGRSVTVYEDLDPSQGSHSLPLPRNLGKGRTFCRRL